MVCNYSEIFLEKYVIPLFAKKKKKYFSSFLFYFIVSGVNSVCLYKQTSLCICGGFSEMYPVCY